MLNLIGITVLSLYIFIQFENFLAQNLHQNTISKLSNTTDSLIGISIVNKISDQANSITNSKSEISFVQNITKESNLKLPGKATVDVYILDEQLEKNTNSNMIVIHNNLSTNRLQTHLKPNVTNENHVIETIISKPTNHYQENKLNNQLVNKSSSNTNVYLSSSMATVDNSLKPTFNENTFYTSDNNVFPVTTNSPFGISNINSSIINNTNLNSNKNLTFQQEIVFSSKNKLFNNKIPDDLIEFNLNNLSTVPSIEFKNIISINSNNNNIGSSLKNNTNFNVSLNNNLNNTNNNLDKNNYLNTNFTLANNAQITQSPNTDFVTLDTLLQRYTSLTSFSSTFPQNIKQAFYKNATNQNSIKINQEPQSSILVNASSTNYSSPEHIYSASTENRLRWIDYRNRPAYPPRMPPVQGIPSGFRNPISTSNILPPSNNNAIPSGMIGGVSTQPLNIPATIEAPYLNLNMLPNNNYINHNNLPNSVNSNTNSKNGNINLASIVNSLSSPTLNTPNFGGSSSNPNNFLHSTNSYNHNHNQNNLNSLNNPNYLNTIVNSNGIIPGAIPNLSPELEAEIEAGLATAAHSFSRRPGVDITRVEHIAAECSDDYMKVVINFNGTFTGLVYSFGYVHDANCIYVNGTGRNGYEFYIRLNQCGTMGREEMHHPKRPGEIRRRDQVMWNTLSIQYNSMIEEEWDEHYRVTCEYGSDYWKTVTFPSFNVEVNTGSPVVFTINPPQCQMEVRRGFGIAGSRTNGPVTVGDPLTLLIHMKSEKAGFDILVKNCISHNGANQRLQLIDTNGCVTNEKLISPFRGTYNSDDGHQVTLYAYLKAFRFTGSPALYLECDIHMCHNKCPPQRCYWRNLSKRFIRSIKNRTFSENNEDEKYDEPFSIEKYNISLSSMYNQDEEITNLKNNNSNNKPVMSESLSLFQALEVRHSDDIEEDIDMQSTSSYNYLNQLIDSTDNDIKRLHSKYKIKDRSDNLIKYSDELDALSNKNQNFNLKKFCFTSGNFMFICICLILIIFSAIFTSIISCIQLRQIRINYLRYDLERDHLSSLSKVSSSKIIYGKPQVNRHY